MTMERWPQWDHEGAIPWTFNSVAGTELSPLRDCAVLPLSLVHVLKIRYAPPTLETLSFPQFGCFWWLGKPCICRLDPCAVLLVYTLPNLGPFRALKQIHFVWFLMKCLVSGHRRGVGGALLFWCGRTKWAPCQKSAGKERMMTKLSWEGERGRDWRLLKQGYTVPLYGVREGGSTPRHWWNIVVFGLPP